MICRYIQIGNIRIGKMHKYLFENIEGLSDGEVTRQETTYSGIDGAEYSEMLFTPRNIKISGTIIAETVPELMRLKSVLISVCSPKAKVDCYYYDGLYAKYYFSALPDSLPTFAKRNKTTMEYIINLTVPGFYIFAEKTEAVLLAKMVPLIDKNSVWPATLSHREKKTVVKNKGHVPSYPKFELYCNEPNESAIIIKNETTGRKCKIDYTMSEGETITVDMENMLAYSSEGNTLLNEVDYNNAFWALEPGNNAITVNTRNIQCMLYHRDRFTGV